jgi:translation initiation factor IF-1
MAGADAFRVEGMIVEALANGTYRAELANGHQLRVYFAGRTRRNAPQLAAGEKVRLQLSPFDLSEGRILGKVESNRV